MKYTLPAHNRLLLKAKWLSVLCVWLLITPTFAQTIRYVKAGGAGNASSWAMASADLQAVINASAAGDQVWVAAGTYKPGGDANTDRTLSFSMKNGVAIYGGFVGGEQALSERPASLTTSQPSSSTLSGDIGTVNKTDDNSNHIVINNNLDNTAVLDGFVITAAYLYTSDFYATDKEGAGMRNIKSSPIIRNCQFIKNSSNYFLAGGGGGMYNGDGSNTTLINCVFANNLGTRGGAIANTTASSLTMTNCIFSYNTSFGSPAVSGGILIINNCSFNNNNGTISEQPSAGGALAIGTGSIITNSLFVSNNGQGIGGAIAIGGSPTITNCTFRGNLASGFGGVINPNGYGGALYIGGGSPIITNCTFSNNIAAARVTSAGGAIYNTGTPIFINCSFGANQSQNGPGGAIYNDGGTPTFINCIIWGNTFDNIVNKAGTIKLTYSISQDQIAGTGNQFTDPQFVDAAGDNLRLKACSPAIDQGDNSVDAGIKDAGNNTRRVRTIDIGAYEFQSTPQNLLTVSQQPNAVYSIPQGGTLAASVSTSGSATAYQWYKNGVALTGVASATTATLTIPNLTVSDQGSYSVVITGVCNSAKSNALRLLVNTGMYTVKTGSWDDPTVWSLNRIPISSDPVQIKHVISIPAGYIAHAVKVGVDAGQRLRMGQASRVRLNQ